MLATSVVAVGRWGWPGAKAHATTSSSWTLDRTSWARRSVSRRA